MAWRPKKVGIRGGEGRSRAEFRTLLLIDPLSGPGEPSWSWTQIWVQARMPAYSLKGTAKSRRWQCCSSPTRRCPSRSRGPSGLESAIDFDTPSVDCLRSSCFVCIVYPYPDTFWVPFFSPKSFDLFFPAVFLYPSVVFFLDSFLFVGFLYVSAF